MHQRLLMRARIRACDAHASLVELELERDRVLAGIGDFEDERRRRARRETLRDRARIADVFARLEAAHRDARLVEIGERDLDDGKRLSSAAPALPRRTWSYSP